MLIIERETVAFVYYAACETMDHDTAVKHAADECGVSVESVLEVMEEEVAA